MTKKGKEGRGQPLNTLVQDFCFYFEQYFYLTCLDYLIMNITNLNVERALVHPVHHGHMLTLLICEGRASGPTPEPTEKLVCIRIEILGGHSQIIVETNIWKQQLILVVQQYC